MPNPARTQAARDIEHRALDSLTMNTTVAIAIGAAGLGAGLFISILVAWKSARSRREILHKIASLVTRLDSTEAGIAIEHKVPVKDALEVLESAIESMTIGGDVGRSDIERISQGLEHLALGLLIVDENGELVVVNAQAREFIDSRPTNTKAASRIQELMDEALRGTKSSDEVELLGPPRRSLRLRAWPLDDGKRHIGAVIVIEDISDVRRMEVIRQDFVANVSHELKTPVGAVALSAEILADETDPAVASRLAVRIRDESTRLARVIEDLLDLSRLEAGFSPPREPVALGLVMAEAMERVRGSAEHKSVRISVWEPEPVAVYGDRRHLVSAAQNLLENAVHYSPEGSVVEIGSAPSDTGIDLWVADEGIGIPEPDLERIFERFYRVDRGRGRESGGTGLGLAIVRHVAQSHGASVEVVSSEGRGSRFTIRFTERAEMPAGPRLVSSSVELDVRSGDDQATA